MIPTPAAVARDDQAAIRRLERGLSGRRGGGRQRPSRAMAKTLCSKDIPYVLLMHSGAFEARVAAPELFEA
ncbi:hypothetical protein ACRAWD_21800 [Caulobacter segnis]